MISVEIKSNKDEFNGELKEKIKMVLDAIGGDCAGKTVQKIVDVDAVDTSRLKNSIDHFVVEEENAVYIGTPVLYGKFVELGTVKMGARPFLKPAVMDNVDEYRKLAEKIFKL